MAKINLGALAQDVRGSLAGSTFSKGRSGSIVRQKVSPVQPRTARQLAQRAIFAEASQAWRDLTDNNRADWINWAASHKVVDVFGMARILAGNAAYIRVNAVRLTAGLAMIAAPPADEGPGPYPYQLQILPISYGLRIEFSDVLPVNSNYLLYATPGHSPGASFVNSQFRLAGVLTQSGAGAQFDVFPKTFNPALTWTPGQRIAVRAAYLGTSGVIQSSHLLTAIVT